jgi:hypothetical protein
VRKVRKEQVYIHTNILQMPLSMRQFSKEFVKKLIIPSNIKQFWPFEEISIFSNGGHLGWRA